MNIRTREQWFFRAARRTLNGQFYHTLKLHGEPIPQAVGLENKVTAFLSQHDDAVLRAAYDRYMALKQ